MKRKTLSYLLFAAFILLGNELVKLEKENRKLKLLISKTK